MENRSERIASQNVDGGVSEDFISERRVVVIVEDVRFLYI
jgi:hypothetical protein